MHIVTSRMCSWKQCNRQLNCSRPPEQSARAELHDLTGPHIVRAAALPGRSTHARLRRKARHEPGGRPKCSSPPRVEFPVSATACKAKWLFFFWRELGPLSPLLCALTAADRAARHGSGLLAHGGGWATSVAETNAYDAHEEGGRWRCTMAGVRGSAYLPVCAASFAVVGLCVRLGALHQPAVQVIWFMRSPCRGITLSALCRVCVCVP